MRRIELWLGIGTALAALAAAAATAFLPIASTGLNVDGGAPIIHHVYARDRGLVRVVVVIGLIVLQGAWILLAAYFHARRGAPLGRTLVLAGAACYVVLTAATVQEGAFAVYPAMLAVVCALFALLPAVRQPASDTGNHR